MFSSDSEHSVYIPTLNGIILGDRYTNIIGLYDLFAQTRVIWQVPLETLEYALFERDSIATHKLVIGRSDGTRAICGLVPDGRLEDLRTFLLACGITTLRAFN